MNSRQYLKKCFLKYYTDAELFYPEKFDKREWGFFINGNFVRHKSFTHESEIKKFITKNVPLHIYYSSAYYRYPSLKMKDKDWQGADLIFDIDADHLDTPCKQQHEFWVCNDCQTASITVSHSQKCPICGSSKMKQETWLCDTCLAVAKNETIKLLDFNLSTTLYS